MSGTGVPANTAPATGEVPSSALSDDTLADFFAPEPTPTPAPAEGTAPVQPAAPAGAQPAVPAAGTPPAPAPVPPPVGPHDPQLNETLVALRESISRMGQPQPQQTAEPPNPYTAIPAYDITLPEPLIEQLNHPDNAVRSRALSAVISATMKTVHQQVLDQMMLHFSALRQEIPNMAQNVVQDRQTREQVTNDFYGTFKEYDTPMLRPVVQLAFVEIVKANPGLVKDGKWTPQLRDALGAYLKANLPLAATPAAGTPPPKGKGPPAPPPLMNGGSRPATENLSGQEKELAEFFG